VVSPLIERPIMETLVLLVVYLSGKMRNKRCREWMASPYVERSAIESFAISLMHLNGEISDSGLESGL
jgi:hypothetical protein